MFIVPAIEAVMRTVDAWEALTSRQAQVIAPSPKLAEPRLQLLASHRVLTDESFCQIAMRYRVSPYQLMVANPGLRNPHALSVGQEIRLPAG